MSTELVCPECGAVHTGDETFCDRCGMPLVASSGEALEHPLNEAHGRARKIDPSYTEGNLVRVAGGRNQPEAEMIQGLLLEEGIPSILRRSAGFDVPDFLAAGPRDVMVPESGAEAALQLLNLAELAPSQATGSRPNPLKLVAAIALGGAATALLAYLLQG